MYTWAAAKCCAAFPLPQPLGLNVFLISMTAPAGGALISSTSTPPDLDRIVIEPDERRTIDTFAGGCRESWDINIIACARYGYLGA